MSRRLLAGIGDLHFPIHDRRAWALTLIILAETRPAKVWLAGDVGNWGSMSRHARKRGEVRSFAQDKEGTRAPLRELYDAIGRAELIVQQGNHDLWVDNYLATNAPEIEGEADFDFPSVLGLRKRDLWVPYNTGRSVGPVYLTHDIGHAGKGALRSNLTESARCIMTGHTHRAGCVYGSQAFGSPHFAMEVGFMGDKQQFRKFPYMSEIKMKDWQHGIGLVDFDKDWELAWARFVPYVEGPSGLTAIVDGKEYRVR